MLKGMRVDFLKNKSLGMSATLLAVLGYGLFRSVNSATYKTAFDLSDASFIFIANIFFTSLVAVMIIATACVCGILAQRGRIKTLHMPYVIPIVVFSIAILATSFNGLSVSSAKYEAILLAFLFAIHSVMVSLAWVEIFAFQKIQDAIIQIGCGMLIGAVLGYFIPIIPESILPIVEVIALVVSGICLHYSRQAIRERTPESISLFEEISYESRKVRNKQALLSLSDSLAAFFALEAVIGLLNSFMLAGGVSFSGANLAASVGMSIAATIFCFLALAAQNAPRINTVFRFCVPILAAMVIFVPFFNEKFSLIFHTLLLMSYDFIAITVTFQIAATAHKYRLNGYTILAVATIGARVCLLCALMAGYALGYTGTSGEPERVHYLFLACGIVYLFAMTTIFISRDHDRKKKKSEGTTATTPTEKETAVVENTAAVNTPTDTESEPEKDHDPILNRCTELANEYSLTAKETEVLSYLARGRTNTYIAEELVISPTTVRSHIRHIYSKLDIHNRQELIDLFQK